MIGPPVGDAFWRKQGAEKWANQQTLNYKDKQFNDIKTLTITTIY